MVNRERFQELIAETEGLESLRHQQLLEVRRVVGKYLIWHSAWEQENTPAYINVDMAGLKFQIKRETAPLYGISADDIVQAQPMAVPSSLLFYNMPITPIIEDNET